MMCAGNFGTVGNTDRKVRFKKSTVKQLRGISGTEK